jgi:alkanesulfonate monooxygenase SsuD/methylene tetrahydromethanopterin reductase-like flavin-dependent oxidoreductase (luciferase family)
MPSATHLDLARHVEQWGYRRYWLAEHHNIPGIVCSATFGPHRVRGGRDVENPWDPAA